jgi:DNA recombination-dependent growth factor C
MQFGQAVRIRSTEDKNAKEIDIQKENMTESRNKDRVKGNDVANRLLPRILSKKKQMKSLQ